MIEIIIHGRGGQGGKKLAKMIALAAFYEEKYVQSFALYGAERRGAPVVSFVRIDDEPIELRGYVTKPDWTIVLDDSLIDLSHGKTILNTNTKILTTIKISIIVNPLFELLLIHCLQLIEHFFQNGFLFPHLL